MLRKRVSALVASVALFVGLLGAPLPAAASPQLFCSYTVSGGSTSTITLPTDCGGGTFLSGGYHSLRLLGIVACDSVVSANVGLRMRINGDTTTKYSSAWDVQGTASRAGAQTSMVISDGPCRTASQATSNTSASFETIIPMAHSTTFDKAVISNSSLIDTTTWTEAFAGFWYPSSPAAVTSLTLFWAGGQNFVAGSVIDVYIE